MKNYLFVILAFVTTSIFTTNLNAQKLTTTQVENAIKADGKYALLVQSDKHFMVSVMTGEAYKAKSKNIQFEIVLIGEVVKDLAAKNELIAFVEKAEKAGIRIVVCEFAMQKLGVKKSDYPAYVDTTANGFTYVFGLQELGFKTIVL